MISVRQTEKEEEMAHVGPLHWFGCGAAPFIYGLVKAGAEIFPVQRRQSEASRSLSDLERAGEWEAAEFSVLNAVEHSKTQKP